MPNWQATIASELRIVGQNSEMSDMANPRGDIISEIYFVMLTDERGNRLCGPIVDNEGSKLAVSLQRSLDKGFDPTTSAAFQPMDPAYGSVAYEQNGTEFERAMLERRDQ